MMLITRQRKQPQISATAMAGTILVGEYRVLNSSLAVVVDDVVVDEDEVDAKAVLVLVYIDSY